MTASDSLKREAANRVLDRLGSDMVEVIKFHMKRSYGISFDQKAESPFSLDQLHFALSVMLGEGHANNLLKQIVEEIKENQRSQVADA